MRSMFTAVLFALVLGIWCSGQVVAQEASSVQKPAAASVVNLNTATIDQLTALPGVGPKMAQRIVEYRQKNGPFKKSEELMNVKGIGEKGFLKIKNLVTVAPPKQERPAGSSL